MTTSTLIKRKNAIIEFQQLLVQFEKNRDNIRQQLKVINEEKADRDQQIAQLRKQLFTGLRDELFPDQEVVDDGSSVQRRIEPETSISKDPVSDGKVQFVEQLPPPNASKECV